MSATQVATHLLNTCSSLATYKSYMFGSYVDSVGVDIDILIIGEPGQTLNKLKCELAKAGALLPLHILYMNPQEALETNFITQQNCVSLIELASGLNRPIAI